MLKISKTVSWCTYKSAPCRKELLSELTNPGTERNEENALISHRILSQTCFVKRIQLSFVLNKMMDGWITRHAQTLTRGHSFLKIPQPVLTFLFCPKKLINFSSIFVIIPVLRTEAASSRVQGSTCFLVHVQKRAHLDLSFSWSVNSVGVLTYVLVQVSGWSVNLSSTGF